MINIVLIEPEIPQNAGNIVRTCSAIGAKLYMVKPLGFELNDKYFKRAGLDYFQLACMEVIDDFNKLYEDNKDQQFYFASTKSEKIYTEVNYPENCFIVFGKESFGIRESLLKKHYKDCIRIPMKKEARSLNLSNSVSIIAYEAMRQQNFSGLKEYGELTGRID